MNKQPRRRKKRTREVRRRGKKEKEDEEEEEEEEEEEFRSRLLAGVYEIINFSTPYLACYESWRERKK
ncbi:hypothetical protein E2C01_050640 [Portunus trituberculatus]|uniref:Uncharacterized protein n=1 Tax=Portunus trituberculatus TaxID=210409 RepID=A0A5B7GGX8_PORTR|nr:hypothetical protein [Portunus trituberculatus]